MRAWTWEMIPAVALLGYVVWSLVREARDPLWGDIREGRKSGQYDPRDYQRHFYSLLVLRYAAVLSLVLWAVWWLLVGTLDWLWGIFMLLSLGMRAAFNAVKQQWRDMLLMGSFIP